MTKSKKILASIFIAGLAFSTLAFSNDHASTGISHYDLNAKDSFENVPVALKAKGNLDANKKKLNYDPELKNANIELHLDLTPTETASVNVLTAEGKGIIHVGDEKFKFDVDPSSRLFSSTLESGEVFVWGAVNGTITDKEGNESQVGLNVSFVPKTNQEFITCTVGSYKDGLGALSFGTNFITKEMFDLQVNHH